MKKRPVWFANGNLVSKERLEINTSEKYLDLINTMERGDDIVFYQKLI